MQDVQNIPVPDSDSNEPNEGLGSHSAVQEDVDNENAAQVDDAEAAPTEQNPPTGFEQVSREESDRTDIERP